MNTFWMEYVIFQMKGKTLHIYSKKFKSPEELDSWLGKNKKGLIGASPLEYTTIIVNNKIKKVMTFE